MTVANNETETENKTDDLDMGDLSFADDIRVAGDSQISWVKALGYGVSGGGKSSVLATMPEPLIILLTEKQGEMSIRRVNPRARIVYIEEMVVCKCHQKNPERCPDGARKGTEKLSAKEVLYGYIDELATKKHPFVSVGLDSLTDLQKILLSHMKGGKAGAKISLPEWGTLVDETRDIVIKLRNLNMHVGVVCLSDEKQDNNNRMMHRPALAGKKLPGDVVQYFNLCFFQRKMRDANAVGGATYESVFDAGDEYYTKTHPALGAVEVPLFRAWVDKIAAHAAANKEGHMPSASSPVSSPASRQANQRKSQETLLKERIEKPALKELYDKLDYPEAKRIAGATKYQSDDKLIEVLKKRIAEAEAAKEEERRKAARDGKEAPVEPPAAAETPAGGSA
jgi:hypothetical protein